VPRLQQLIQQLGQRHGTLLIQPVNLQQHHIQQLGQRHGILLRIRPHHIRRHGRLRGLQVKELINQQRPFIIHHGQLVMRLQQHGLPHIIPHIIQVVQLII